jgi:hypothetical protein
MADFTNNFGNLATRSGLYRVWVPVGDDGESPLISIWIDPYLRAFEPRVEEEKTLPLDTGTSVVPFMVRIL